MKIATLLLSFLFIFGSTQGQTQRQLTEEMALAISRAPLQCIPQEFPNKTSHLADGTEDARLLPHELHPAFYGCLDWHSCVHSHWTLVKILQTFPELANRDSIILTLEHTFQKDKMEKEAEYFGKYTASDNYERTYGWAWLLKLDETLGSSPYPIYQKWHHDLQPLTQKIVALWKAYLPKLTYPNRTGMHYNTAFGLDFALDWARYSGDTAFERAIIEKSLAFYGTRQNIPAYLEPDGTDFFSPSLLVAELISKIMSPKAFINWFNHYYTQESIDRLCELPVVSDRSDYHIVHLDGLAFSRAWCMRSVIKKLPDNHPAKAKFLKASERFLNAALPQIFDNYGGSHWLGTFAVYALLN